MARLPVTVTCESCGAEGTTVEVHAGSAPINLTPIGWSVFTIRDVGASGPRRAYTCSAECHRVIRELLAPA